MAQKVKTDWILFYTVVGVVFFGLLILYSASSVLAEIKQGNSFYYVIRQGFWALISLPVLMIFKRVDYRRLNTAGWAFPAIGIAIMFLIVVYFLDSSSHRWLHIGPLGIQPSELAKPALVVFLAFFLTQRAQAINNRYTLVPAAVAIGCLTGLVLLADIGTAVVLGVTAAVVFLVAGLDLKYIGIAAMVAFLFVVVAIVSKPYRLGRIVGHFDPEFTLVDRFDPSGHVKEYLRGSTATRDPSYQVRQSKIAIGSGGLLGLGPMQGKQKLFYLPEPHTDFIYAVIGEELGFLGAGAVVLAFLIVGWRGVRLSLVTPDHFGRYLALGITTMVVVQAFMNISVVLGIAPTKGIPLPMISHGGSSLLSTLSSLGMLLSVSDHSG